MDHCVINNQEPIFSFMATLDESSNEIDVNEIIALQHITDESTIKIPKEPFIWLLSFTSPNNVLCVECSYMNTDNVCEIFKDKWSLLLSKLVPFF